MKAKYIYISGMIVLSIMTSGCSLNKKYRQVAIPYYKYDEENTVNIVEEKVIPFEETVYKEDFIEYRVKKGDTLLKISRKFNVDVRKIVRENNLKNPDKIYEGMLLVIPSEEKKNIITSHKWNKKRMKKNLTKKNINNVALADKKKTEIVCKEEKKQIRKQEDNLKNIKHIETAQSCSVYSDEKKIEKVKKMQECNDKNEISDGERFYITHQVEDGENLWKIAQFYGVEYEELKKVNHLADAKVKEGQSLIIPLK